MKKNKQCSLIASAECIQPRSWIQTQVSLSSLSGQPAEAATAIWDTGATRSGVSMRLVKALGLNHPVRVTERYADGKERETQAYWILVTFPCGRQARVLATAHEAEDIDCIIGMDLICYGTFLLEPTADGNSRFTFTLNV